MAIDVNEFVSVVQPALEQGRPDDVAALVAERWTTEEVCGLLEHDQPTVRRLAAAATGLIGECGCSQYLVVALHDEDASVHETAEHAIWQVWFHCCKPAATGPFQQGMEYLQQDELDEAVTCFRRCQQADPKFAEAYHQCAIAHYLAGDYDQAMDDCERTLELIPIHFGALAQMGHCHMQRGEWCKALDAYRSALRINPRMPGIDMAVERLERKVG